MQPRTFFIVAVALLVGGVVMRFVIIYFGLLPVSEEVVLKKAVAVSVTYFDQGQQKSLTISEPSQVREVLAALRMKEQDESNPWGLWSGPALAQATATVSFQFANGLSRNHGFDGTLRLGQFIVDPGFYHKLREVVSTHEGHDVDILAPDMWRR